MPRFAACPSCRSPPVGGVKTRRATYSWQYSRDCGDTWVDTPATFAAKTVVSGLPLGVVQFRYRALTGTGQGEWSHAISLLVG